MSVMTMKCSWDILTYYWHFCWESEESIFIFWYFYIFPDSKVHMASMGPIWGRQDPMLAPWTLLSGLTCWNSFSLKTKICILYNKKHGWWWTGDIRSQGINSYGIDPVVPECFRFSTRQIESSYRKQVIIKIGIYISFCCQPQNSFDLDLHWVAKSDAKPSQDCW